jgi:hypothetical protein
VRFSPRLRKRWVYVAAFSDEVMACAARVQVGPMGQTFWALLDRSSRELHEHTRTRLPGTSGEVRAGPPTDASEGFRVTIESAAVSGVLEMSGGPPWEATCPTEEGREVWTRKRAGVKVGGRLTVVDGRTFELDALGVIDETDGYHPRHTVWSWSAGVGRTTDGRSIGWNLVQGVNDPPERSERAIWVDGEPFEPGPVSFDGLEGIGFEDGSRLEFQAEAERRKSESLLFIRYSYRQPFGSFSGTLPGGLVLEQGLGVMEHHDALW